MNLYHGYELAPSEVDQLEDAHRDGVEFYNRFRTRGHPAEEAFRLALSKARNLTEQHSRRLSHATGAEGWL